MSSGPENRTAGWPPVGASSGHRGAGEPAWQASFQTGFIVQGNTEKEEIINTDKSWKCIEDSAYAALQPQLIYTYYAAGPAEKIDMNKYPDAWTSLNFDDTSWLDAHELFTGTPKYVHNWNSGWMLVPRQIPMMELTPQRLQKIRAQKNVTANEGFLKGDHPIQIAPHTTTHILLDQQFLTNAFSVIQFSKGKNANLQLTYAEALYINEPNNKDWRSQNQKGNRNEVEGKHIVGMKDEIISSGKEHQTFSSLSYRTYRYVALDITTQDEALILEDIYGVFTGYPFKLNSSFTSNDPSLYIFLISPLNLLPPIENLYFKCFCDSIILCL